MTEHSLGESVPASCKSEACCQTAVADLLCTDEKTTRILLETRMFLQSLLASLTPFGRRNGGRRRHVRKKEEVNDSFFAAGRWKVYV
jgi:hypothetical protein